MHIHVHPLTCVARAWHMHQVIASANTDPSIGSFTAFTQYVSLFEQGFSSGANIWLQLRQNVLSAGRFVQLLERQPAVRPNAGDDPGARGERCRGELELRDVSAAFPPKGAGVAWARAPLVLLYGPPLPIIPWPHPSYHPLQVSFAYPARGGGPAAAPSAPLVLDGVRDHILMNANER